MASQQNQIAVQWVIDEVQTALKNAQKAFEIYLADDNNKSQLGFCRVTLHQVVGSLRMVELQGAALLAEEIELLADQIDGMSDSDTAKQVLLRALMQLPIYLDKIMKSRYDEPSMLLPLLNDLRAIRKERLLTETSFFIPDLKPLDTVLGSVSEASQNELTDLLAKIASSMRSVYKAMRDGDLSEQRLGQFNKLSLHLYKAAQGSQKSAFAELFVGISTAIKDGRVKMGPGVDAVIYQLVKHISQTVKQTNNPLEQSTPTSLVKNLLFYIYTAKAYNKITKTISGKYALDHALLKSPVESLGESDWIDAPAEDNLDRISGDIQYELGRVVQLLNSVEQRKKLPPALFVAASSVLARIADTFAVLGKNKLRTSTLQIASQMIKHELNAEEASIVNEKVKLLIRKTADIKPGQSLPMREVDEREEQLQMANESVLREAKNGLEQVKDAITEYIASQWQESHLANVPKTLRDIRGGLEIALEGRAGKVLGACARYIEEQLIGSHETPQWTDLDTLADAVSGIEYYLERLDTQAADENEAILSGAEQSVASLGFHVVPVSASIEAPILTDIETHEDDKAVDDEVLEIFLEEVDEVHETIVTQLPIWQQTQDLEARAEVRRAYHTLKGSGRMVGANVLAELCWSTENLLNRVIDKTTAETPDLWVFLDRVTREIPALRNAFATDSVVDNAAYIAMLEAAGYDLVKGNPLPTFSDQGSDEESHEESHEESDDEAVEQITDIADTLVETDDDDGATSAATRLTDTFAVEAESYLQELDIFVDAASKNLPIKTAPTADLQRALHTLKGAASMASFEGIFDVAGALELLVKEQRAHAIECDADLLAIYTQVATQLQGAILVLDMPWSSPELVQEIDATRAEISGRSAKYDEGGHLVDLLVDADFAVLSIDGVDSVGISTVTEISSRVDELCAIAAMSEMGHQPGLSQLANALAAAYRKVPEDVTDEQFSAYLLLLNPGHVTLIESVDQLAAGQDVNYSELILADINDLAWPDSIAPLETEREQAVEPEQVTEPEQAPEPEQAVEPEQTHKSAPENESIEFTAPTFVTPVSSDESDDDVDIEIVEIFLDEAAELLEEYDAAVHAWRDAPEAREPRNELLRVLHTFKGGARLAGASALGDLSHECESEIEALRKKAFDEALYSRLLAYQDQMQQGVDLLQHQVEAGQVTETQLTKPIAVTETVENAQDNSEQANVQSQAVVLPFGTAEPSEPRSDNTPSQLAQSMLDTRHTAPQEIVKVNAELLEELVNLAGETSISRSRVEQQVSDASYALDEMDAIIGRLTEQLRRLDIETEAQILYRTEQVSDVEDDTFDPLEMDRYSQLQQLSRSLMESASDILDLKGTLADRNRSTESLLLQQSRINTELQEGLMRSRMVSFSRIVPRLRRIIRQVGAELSKQVEFKVGSVDGEVDRTILERLQSPLEHMLRNAIDHGIEASSVRREAGKPASGTVSLDLARDGGDVLVRIKDDGAGINLTAVRQKAIDQNLLTEDQVVSDHELQQFILMPGFSTAAEVTQISGRGVGMDVVNSEIKHMGGSIVINSEPDVGTEMVIRLPFTVSVNRALMVKIGDSQYAIPLNAIEGVVRVSPYELNLYYDDQQQGFEYGGRSYGVRYLGEMLHTKTRPNVQDEYLPCPVILVRTTDYPIALHVDSLLGSKEVVVKSLGPQFAAVPGLSGATVLGDGSVVVILDVLAMVRSTNLLRHDTNVAIEHKEEDDSTLVMVVDDSLTVRKVTTRFLERQGMQVVTAKDGQDALRLLQDITPDVMLLDIEMPRMDGYEVASTMKAGVRWRDIPICMITSRTGDKHRRRALDMGVERYIGKPYQEDELLQIIGELIGAAVET